MFSHGDIRESATNVVTVDDVSQEVMSKFLDFALGKDIELSSALEAGEMLMAADKYDITGLFKFCEQKVHT
jgi:hypothetical protein